MNDFKKELQKEEANNIEVVKVGKHKKLKMGDVDDGSEYDPLKNYWVGEVFNIIVFAAVSLIPIGLLTLLDPHWDWTVYATWLFWIDYLIIQGVSWYGRWWIFSTKRRFYLLVDVEYLNNEKQIQEFVDKDHEEPFIEMMADEDNHNRKVRAWRRKIKRKLIKVNNRWHINNMSTHFKTTENGSKIVSKPFELKSDKIYHHTLKKKFWSVFNPFIRIGNWKRNIKTTKLNAKINAWFELLSDEWIETNVDTIKVKYSKVSHSILVSGFTPNQTVNDESNYKTESAKVFLSETMPMFIFVSFIMFLIVPLFGSGLSKDLSAWGMFFTKVALVASSVIMVWLSARRMFKATEVKAIGERNVTLNKYWKRRQQKIKEALN